jgi:hypothetical protein
VTPLYPQKLALTSPTGGGRSVGIVRSRTKATEFSLVFFYIQYLVFRKCDNVEKYSRDRQATKDNITRRMRCACWITEATDTRQENVIAIPWQQWSREHASVLGYMYIACLVNLHHTVTLYCTYLYVLFLCIFNTLYFRSHILS